VDKNKNSWQYYAKGQADEVEDVDDLFIVEQELLQSDSIF
jgi:hypothetical protein